MPFAIDLSQLRPRQREHYLPPYRRHAWEGRGPGLFSHDVCAKCRRLESSPGGAGLPCDVVLAGPPRLAWDCLTYPGGLTVRQSEVE